jgi:hypothetical protein
VTTANAAADLRTAKTDTRVQSLLKQVSRFYKIKYQEVEGPVWFSKINGADVIIGYATANHPAGCLGHELLHLILQKDGFRQIRRGISATIPDAMRLIDVLNNELQHHKMFPLFVEAKFPGDHFYNDSDTHIHQHIQDDIGKLGANPVDVAVLTLTIMAPGGILTAADQARYLDELSKIHSGHFRSCVSEVAAAVKTWQNNSSLDSENTIRAIFRAVKNPSRSWFAYSPVATPPREGFFTDEKFVVEPP